MRIRVAVFFALALFFVTPSRGESMTRGGRFGVGYSLYPIAGDLGTFRYSSYKLFFESGFKFANGVALGAEEVNQVTFGGKIGLRLFEYRGIPLELGGSLAVVTDGTINENGDARSLVDAGAFVGFSTLITEEVSAGIALYPVALGMGGVETEKYFCVPVFNLHFLF